MVITPALPGGRILATKATIIITMITYAKPHKMSLTQNKFILYAVPKSNILSYSEEYIMVNNKQDIIVHSTNFVTYRN